MALQPRKERGRATVLADRAASMGPWLCSHGRSQGGCHREAARQCFNGAVALQPRKENHLNGFLYIAPGLQWGRGFAATEGNGRVAMGRGQWLASMGPWLCSHGRRPRRLRVVAVQLASMGPWLCSHGRFDRGISPASHDGLQWGRGFAATEGARRPQEACRCYPLQWGRGFAATEGRVGRRGLPRRGCFNGAVALQPRKGESDETTLQWRSRLQWGRGFAATEGGRSQRNGPKEESFNGAVALQPRKEGLPKSFHTMGPKRRLRAPRRNSGFSQPFASTRSP